MTIDRARGLACCTLLAFAMLPSSTARADGDDDDDARSDDQLPPDVFVETGVGLRPFRDVARPTWRALAAAPMSAAPTVRVPTYDGRVGVGVWRALSVAAEVVAVDAPASLAPMPIVYAFGSARVTGWLGDLSIAGEVAAGALVSQLQAMQRSVGAVEVRGRIALPVGPAWTFGACGGASLLGAPAWLAGIDFGFHVRSPRRRLR